MFYSRYSGDKGSAGFTLIELLNVIVIIGIVSAVGIPKFSQYKNKAYDIHAKRALKDMHLLCNAFWIDTYPAQECDLPTIKDTYYGFNQNSNILATLPPAPSDTFCATAKHDSSPNVFSINNASLISSGEKCGVSIVNASFPPRPAFICSGTFQDPCPKMGCDEECTKQKAQDRLLAVINELPHLMRPSSTALDDSIQEIQSRTYSDDSDGTPTMTENSSVNELLAATMEPPLDSGDGPVAPDPAETAETTPDKILRCNPGADIIQAVQAIDIGVRVSMTGGGKYSRSGKLYDFEYHPGPADFEMYYSSPGMRVPADITREMVLAKQAELNAICSADPTTLKHEKFCEEGESPRLINNSTFSCQR